MSKDNTAATRDRRNYKTKRYEPNPEVDAFLSEIIAVCIKHNLMIGHEDTHGAFIVMPCDGSFEDHDWLWSASYDPS